MSTNISSAGHFGPSHDDTSSLGSGHAHDDLDIDFSLTESGRTVAHLVSHLKDDFADTPDFVDKALAIAEEEEPEFASTSVGFHHHEEQQIQNHQSHMNDNHKPITQPGQLQQQQQELRRSQPKAIPQQLNHSSQPGSGSQGSPSSFFNAMSHTPPGALAPTSYEAQHFGKRIRSGSISGRLRSASDLEDLGFIDRQQKTVLKDLIISGDEALQAALDKFESGDTSTLQNLIQSGAFSSKAAQDIDLLGDLDLDFLTVDDYAGMEEAAVTTSTTNDNMHAAGGGNVDGSSGAPPLLQPHSSEPIPMQPPPHFPTKQQVQQMMSNNSTSNNNNASNLPAPNMVSPSLQSAYTGEGDDGIGELDFNGEFAGGEQDYVQLPSTTASAAQAFGQGRAIPSPDLQEQTRFRSNSLAFGALLSSDYTPHSGDAQEVYGRWMDPANAAQLPNNGNNENKKVKAKSTSKKLSSRGSADANSMQTKVQDANGGVFILNPNQQKQQQQERGGIGASLAQYGRSKSDSKLKTKKELAEERRREKQLKKEEKEREKQLKKERREQEMREKKERDARDRAEKKERKAAAVRAKQQKQKQQQQEQEEVEERKETPSGLGRPRSMSDPNLKVSTDIDGLMEVERPDGWIGAYSPESRKMRIERFLEKRNHRVWTKTVKYDVRKNFADSRLRVKGRFVKKEDELLMRDLMSLT